MVEVAVKSMCVRFGEGREHSSDKNWKGRRSAEVLLGTFKSHMTDVPVTDDKSDRIETHFDEVAGGCNAKRRPQAEDKVVALSIFLGHGQDTFLQAVSEVYYAVHQKTITTLSSSVQHYLTN